MIPIQPEGLTQLEKTARNIYEAFNLQEELTGERPNVTATEVALNEMSRRIDTQRFAYSQNYKEEDKMREEIPMATGMVRLDENEYWSLYHVIAIAKEDAVSGAIPEIDKKIVAKNKEHARGLAGVDEMLKRYDYDNTKVVVVIREIIEIKPVEDDE